MLKEFQTWLTYITDKYTRVFASRAERKKNWNFDCCMLLFLFCFFDLSDCIVIKHCLVICSSWLSMIRHKLETTPKTGIIRSHQYSPKMVISNETVIILFRLVVSIFKIYYTRKNSILIENSIQIAHFKVFRYLILSLAHTMIRALISDIFSSWLVVFK